MIKRLIKQLKCEHEYLYKGVEHKKKVSQTNTPFRYTVVLNKIKCEKCGREILRDADWCYEHAVSYGRRKASDGKPKIIHRVSNKTKQKNKRSGLQ